MSNDTYTPNGFGVASSFHGSEFSRVGEYTTNASTAAIFVGDIVKTAKGNILSQAGATDANIGPVTGVQYVDSNGIPVYGQYWHGNVTGAQKIQIFVADDPWVILEAQSDESLDDDNLQQNVSLVTGTGNTIDGISGMGIDGSSAAATGTLPFRIIQFAPGSDSDDSFPRVWLLNNKHQYRSTTGQS